MAVNVDWFGFAENVAADSRGALSLIGFAPAFIVLPKLPTNSQISLILILKDDESPQPTFVSGKTLTFEVRIYDPDGKQIVGSFQNSQLSDKKYEEVPGVTLVVANAALLFQKYGRYNAEVSVNIDGMDSELHASRDIYVVSEYR